VEAVAQQLQQAGLALPRDVISHALLPLPDTPYMNCMAKLPHPWQSRVTSSGGVSGIIMDGGGRMTARGVTQQAGIGPSD
jgi:hypothetical protein